MQFGDAAEEEKLIAIVRNRSSSIDDRLAALTDCLARPNEKVAALVGKSAPTPTRNSAVPRF